MKIFSLNPVLVSFMVLASSKPNLSDASDVFRSGRYATHTNIPDDKKYCPMS